MEKQDSKEKKCIQFESADLFKELAEGNQLRSLRSVKSNPYPNYRFVATEKVIDIVSKFIVNHNMKSDRTVDENWDIFENTVIKADKKPGAIVTRNLRVVKRVIDEGYGCMLTRTGVDQHKKKFFVFYDNDRISEIKSEEDAKSREKFEQKVVIKPSVTDKETTKSKINLEISKLLKKAMEEQK